MDIYLNEFLNGNKTDNKRFKYASLFSGIGGFETALNALGGECVFASEIDKYARQSYKALYGHEPSGDITKIEAEDVPDHDILVGGFPCQAFSLAGKRGGFEDTRGTLIYDVVRIAFVKQPSVLLLENVKGLVSHDKGKTLDTIVKIINDAGYRVDFQVLNSKYFGVPQNRERIFIVCIREDLIANEDWVIKGSNVVAKGKKRISQYDGVKTFNFDYPTNDTIQNKLSDFLLTSVDEKFYLDEEKTEKLVKQMEERNNKAIKESSPNKVAGLYGKSQAGSVYDTGGVSPTLDTAAGGYREPIITESIGHTMNRNELKEQTDVSHCLMARDYKGLGNQDMTGVVEQECRAVLTPDRTNKSQNGRQIKDVEEPMFTLTAQDQHGVAENDKVLFIKEATKQGYAVAEVGDAVNTQFPNSETRRGRVGKEIANTLEASGCNQGVVTTDIRIRKLTPKECWRLQGFSDEQHDLVEKAGVSNSQRYKQAGNAVTVNVIHAIAQRLTPYL